VERRKLPQRGLGRSPSHYRFYIIQRGSIVAAMIKHCEKFHFRIFRHGFLISKHVRTGRHGILAPALKAETSIYLICQRVGLSTSSLSASWFVGELSSYRKRGGEERGGRTREGEEAFLVMWPRRFSALNPPPV